MTRKKISSWCRKYVFGAFAVVAIGAAIAYVIAIAAGIQGMNGPIMIAAGYSLVIALVCALTWQWVVKKHKDFLPNYHTAVSAFRMLAALATVTVVYLQVGREQITPYVLTFMGFYVVMLGYHALIFTKINSQLDK